ncbi:MAG: hypothetical protein U9532_02550 ['Conium maculatum' witches'-broom phytoplasma]|nr:hypothetical protein ['Conium maculatum' witches'-broom phytoplasma]
MKLKKKSNPFEILKLKNELEEVGLATYGKDFFDQIDHKYLKEHKTEFFNDNNISYRLKIKPEPSNLAIFIKNRHPFDRWNKRGATSEDFGFIDGFDSASFYKKDDSYLLRYINFEKQKNKGPGGNYLILKYKGPKNFLEEDKDFYLGTIFTHNDQFFLTDFYLYFNPVRNTLSIFKNKHNNDKTEEAEMNKDHPNGR